MLKHCLHISQPRAKPTLLRNHLQRHRRPHQIQLAQFLLEAGERLAAAVCLERLLVLVPVIAVSIDSISGMMAALARTTKVSVDVPLKHNNILRPVLVWPQRAGDLVLECARLIGLDVLGYFL